MYFFQWEAPRILTPADRHRLGKYLLDAVPQTADPNMFLSPAWGEVKRSEDPLRDQGSRGDRGDAFTIDEHRVASGSRAGGGAEAGR